MTPAALLANLRGWGVEVRARGDKLRLSPQSALTPELLALVKDHKPGLLELLTTPAFSAAESRMLAGAPADMLAAVEAVKRVFPGAEVTGVQRPAPSPRWVGPHPKPSRRCPRASLTWPRS